MKAVREPKRSLLARTLLAFTAAVLLTPYLMGCSVYAKAEIGVRNDTYDRMYQAANINAVMTVLKNCSGSFEKGHVSSVASGRFNPAEVTASDIKSGSKLFKSGWLEHETNVAAPLWLEQRIEGKSDTDHNGIIHCNDGENSSNIIHIAAEFLKVSPLEILCSPNDGETGALWKNYENGTVTTRADCINSKAAGKWKLSADEDRIRATIEANYANIRAAADLGPDYWPTAGEIGDFNNLDGYFTYINDFNTYCAQYATRDESEVEGKSAITEISVNGTGIDGKIKRKLYWYGITSGAHGWTKFASESEGSCSGMLDRIAILEKSSNGIVRTAHKTMNGESATYPNIVKNQLNEDCKNATVKGDSSRSVWEVVDEVAADPEASEEDKAEADRVKGLISNGVYIQDKEEEGFKVWQCVETTLADVKVNDFTPDDTDSPDSEAEDTCYTHSGALGWIACPLIDGLGKVIKEKYTEWVEPALKIDPGLFAGGTDNPTAKAWAVFQTIANIGFVIFILIIIFSQLTGIGIDNYGIKKTLPRLLVAAILINLSYIICQLVVDIGNIFGAGIGSLFVEISNAIDEPGGLTQGFWGSATSSGWNAVIVACVGALTAAAVWTQGLALIIPILMVLISVACAVIATMALLGLRQAMAVLLVVFSPLAFLCYMLPNTKSLYDKWFKTFKGLIVAYPVCSAVIFGGDMIGRILLSTAQNDNYWVVISAALISVAPVFVIPKIIEKSMGAIGNMVGGWGRSGGRRLGNMAAGSQVLKNVKNANEQRLLRHRAGIKFDSDGNAHFTARGKMQNFGAGFRRSHPRLGAVLGGAAATTSLNATRASAMRAFKESGDAAHYTNEDALDVMNSELSSNKRRTVDQARESEISVIKDKFGGDAQILKKGYSEMVEALNGGNGARYEELGGNKRFEAFATALARTNNPEAQKYLGSVIAGGGAAATQLAHYAATGDESVMDAIGKKSITTQQMARDIATGDFDAGEYDKSGARKDAWGNAGFTTKTGETVSNMYHMGKDIIDTPAKLANQGNQDIPALVKASNGSEYAISDQMLIEAMNSETLRSSDFNKVETIQKAYIGRKFSSDQQIKQLSETFTGYGRDGIGKNDLNDAAIRDIRAEAERQVNSRRDEKVKSGLSGKALDDALSNDATYMACLNIATTPIKARKN